MGDAVECWVCREEADPTGGAAAAPTGCACRGSAGRAHLSCLVANARHGADYDIVARPSCVALMSGTLRGTRVRRASRFTSGLARAHWCLQPCSRTVSDAL